MTTSVTIFEPGSDDFSARLYPDQDPDRRVQVFLGSSHNTAYLSVEQAHILLASLVALPDLPSPGDEPRPEDSDDFPAPGPWGCDDDPPLVRTPSGSVELRGRGDADGWVTPL